MQTDARFSPLPPLSQEQLDRIVQALRSQYPGWVSFEDPRFIEDEIAYKKKTIAKAADLLSPRELRRLLGDGRFDEVIKRLEIIGRDNNLLYQSVPMTGDLGILYRLGTNQAAFCAALVDLLYGKGESPDRLGRYLSWVESAGLPNRWTFPTYFLYMCHPESEIFVKPGATAGFLELLGFKEELRGGPSLFWYARILDLAHQLRHAFSSLGAKDMVDIQSVIWIVGRHGGVRYWKVAPERGAVLWDTWREGGYISIGWEKLGDVSRLSREEFEIRRREIEREDEEYTAQGARQVWDFAHIREGDQVVANRGHKQVLGIGTVSGPYMFLPDVEHGHRIPVQWTDLRSREVNQKSWNNTLRSLTRKQFQEILNSPVIDPVAPPLPPPPSFEALRASLRSTGLYFPAEVVSNYLLALQTKRFVILTGISGTGKTRLALGVAQYFQPRVRTAKTVDIPDGAREVTVAPYMIKYNRIVLPSAFVGILSLPSPNPETNKSSIEVVYPQGRTRLSLGRSGDRDVIMLLFRGEFRSWFGSSLTPGDKIYLAAEEPEDGPSVIHVGIPQTVVEEAAVENYVVEAVRPDWTDHRGLLGYFNPLVGRYVSTPFLDLVLRAKEEEEKARDEDRDPHPFFAILDEMNLARVEHYFSDFLSALESDEPLRLHDEASVESGETEDAVPIPRSIKVPRNLFFTGTVNVDESTYMFSPKVLDRAFTLELNEVDLDSLSSLEDPEDGASGLRLLGFSERLTFEGSPSSADWDLLEEQPKEVVKELNSLLAEENRHFGYRVATEISRFVTLADEQGDGEGAQHAGLDLALLQKVLPKLHGTQQELEDLLKKLRQFGSEAALPRFTNKVERMLRRLERQGFTSFIE